jgi:hypothetical protein
MTRTGQFAAAASFALAGIIASATSAPAKDDPCFFKGTMYSGAPRVKQHAIQVRRW